MHLDSWHDIENKCKKEPPFVSGQNKKQNFGKRRILAKNAAKVGETKKRG
jgi:hypothetical protein